MTKIMNFTVHKVKIKFKIWHTDKKKSESESRLSEFDSLFYKLTLSLWFSFFLCLIFFIYKMTIITVTSSKCNCKH